MNIEEFVNNYLQEHRHDVLLNPYNGLIDFANTFKKQMLKDAVEAVISQCPGSNEIIFYNPSTVYSWEFPWKFSAKGLNKGDKVRIVVLKEEEE